jgi:putative redox protein
MGVQRLTWLPDAGWLQFEGSTAYGAHVRLGGDPDGEGAKPSDLVPLSLAACTAYDVVEILRKQRQDLRALEVTVRSEQDREPPWAFRSIVTRFVLAGDVDEAKARKAVALAEGKYCAVAATLRDVVELGFEVEVRPTDGGPAGG